MSNEPTKEQLEKHLGKAVIVIGPHLAVTGFFNPSPIPDSYAYVVEQPDSGGIYVGFNLDDVFDLAVIMDTPQLYIHKPKRVIESRAVIRDDKLWFPDIPADLKPGEYILRVVE